MNPKVVKLREEREKNVAKIASLQERNKKIDVTIIKIENSDIIGMVREFGLSPDIDKRMVQAGTINMAAYLRKMAIDGYVVKLELPELRGLISLLRRTSNNFNQIAKRVNSTNRIYAEDIHEMKMQIEETWVAVNKVLEKLAAVE